MRIVIIKINVKINKTLLGLFISYYKRESPSVSQDFPLFHSHHAALCLRGPHCLLLCLLQPTQAIFLHVTSLHRIRHDQPQAARATVRHPNFSVPIQNMKKDAFWSFTAHVM